jgi:hypothetical protein
MKRCDPLEIMETLPPFCGTGERPQRIFQHPDAGGESWGGGD